MKKIIPLLLILILVSLIAFYKDEVFTVYKTYYIEYKSKNISIKNNQYFRNYDFEFVKNTNNFNPNNKSDLINIIYSTINSGEDKFTFYCPVSYNNCINDLDSIITNQELLSDINNFVHPFNSFKHIEFRYDVMNKITLTINKNYNKEDIELIEDKVNNNFNNFYNESLSLQDNIKIFHDLIINNSKYDSNRSDNNIIQYKSDVAYGPLFEGYALCGGYSDLIQLYLEKLKIKNFKVSSKDHVWNAVYLNDKWYNLDLTWDDPVTNTREDILLYDYFLINSKKLLELDQTQHLFNEDIYKELKRTI